MHQEYVKKSLHGGGWGGGHIHFTCLAARSVLKVEVPP